MNICPACGREDPVEDPVGLRVLRSLAPRQRQLLSLAMLGLRDADIGLRMNIAHNTVRKVLNAIYTKTGMGSKPELMAFVFEHQIILRGCRALD